MLLTAMSIVLSAGIVFFAIRQARIGFGGYRATTRAVLELESTFEPVHDGESLLRTLGAARQNEDRTVRHLGRALARALERSPIRVGRVVGWSVDVEHLCEGEPWFRRHTRYGLLEAMPGLLTGAGILFTFLGLIVGLYGLDPTDADQLTSGVKRLLGGMSVAFLTSVAGIASALWWTWVQRGVVHAFHDAFHRLGETLSTKPFLLNPFDLNDQLVHHLAAQSQSLENLGEHIATAIITALKEAGINGEQDPDLDETRPMSDSGWLPGLREELANMSEYLSDLIKVNRALEAKIGAMAVGGGNAPVQVPVPSGPEGEVLRQSLDRADKLQRLQQTVVTDIATAAKSLRDVTAKASNIGDVMGRQQESAARHLATLERAWADYRDQINTMQATMVRTLAAFQTDLPRSLRAVHGEFDQLLSDSLKHFAGALGEFETSLQSLTVLLERQSNQQG